MTAADPDAGTFPLPEIHFARQFGTLAHGREEAVRLDLCAFQIGRIIEPRFNQLRALEQLDHLAEDARDYYEGPGDADPPAAVAALNRVIFHEQGFRGDTETYYDPGNSCLHRVLLTGRGMPITLAVIMIEVGRRLGLTLHGVGAPFHFLVKYAEPNPDDPARPRETFLDPFHGGREIDRAALSDRLHATNRGAGPNPDSFLAAVTKRQILQRILTNLKGAGIRQRAYPAAVSASDYLLALNPWSLEERRDRGLLQYQTGHYLEALDDLQQYQLHTPNAPDADRINDFIKRVQTRLAAGG